MHTSNAIHSITSLTTALKSLIEGGFPFVWVKGQVANLSRPSSGHIYFSLKDEAANLNAVWFRNAQQSTEKFDPLTGEVYEDGPRPSLAGSLQNGQEIVCAGKLTVYAQRGSYQLVVELAHDAGMGALHIQFEYLCKKLRGAGYFDESRKRPLPVNPARVAVITAPGGAAIHDFLRTAETRGFGSSIYIYPALMQGENAPEQIIAQIHKANTDGHADVLVLIRGGGSLEDLQAFNSEQVATAIKDSRLPVLAGIGHEVDFTLADMTADRRASTPTQAAHVLWTDRRESLQRMSSLTARLHTAERKYFVLQQKRLADMQKFIMARSPHYRLRSWQQQFTSLTARLERLMSLSLARREAELVLRDKGLAYVYRVMEQKRARAQELTKRLEYCSEKYLDRKRTSIEKLALQLEGKNPLRPLERGYALVHTADGQLVQSVLNIAAGQQLDITLADGTASASVMTVRPQSALSQGTMREKK